MGEFWIAERIASILIPNFRIFADRVIGVCSRYFECCPRTLNREQQPFSQRLFSRSALFDYFKIAFQCFFCWSLAASKRLSKPLTSRSQKWNWKSEIRSSENQKNCKSRQARSQPNKWTLLFGQIATSRSLVETCCWWPFNKKISFKRFQRFRSGQKAIENRIKSSSILLISIRKFRTRNFWF